jgi:carboxymethylenebutenolidase
VLKQPFTIDVAGNAMPAYLARPEDGTPRPAVIVLQEIFGVNAEVQRITDLVASAGYVAVAINYYHRTHPNLNEPYTADGLQNGFAAAKNVTRATLTADLTATMDWLNAQDFVKFNHIATWGFCFGGTVAFLSATLEGVACAISFYGGSIASPMPNGDAAMLTETPNLKAPLLLAFGGNDDYIPQTDVENIRTTLTAAHKRFQIQVYPDMGHAFFRDSSASLDDGDEKAKCVADAWDLVQAFLAEHCS